ncbi:hypothetical protein GKE82_17425 [Conexibacter sp. W3-3-2]|uniref:Uncharacterized protein n=1 Tax=Paraconexibacter algicola TaxID=2133960 RepID=A0A2T4UKB6_9ACTN|nr:MULTISPECIES: sulfite exporter TauE/SafE family protein [Solirubrobacterales]MTD46018.1 hypothetical protein [Conexibacter sp. W3-3-2]PTL59683.1 hypothetical protein C7Y72_08485 [Paraconexibacter algicola]
MPSYVHAMFGAVGLTLVVAVLAPAPRMPVNRAARACRVLMISGGLLWIAAFTMPAFDVWYPALALLGAAMGTWFGMFWLARQPSLYDLPPERAEHSDDADDDDQGGGGGGGRGPEPDPGPEPSGPDGIDWDDFDRQRRSWESDRDRTPVGTL